MENDKTVCGLCKNEAAPIAYTWPPDATCMKLTAACTPCHERIKAALTAFRSAAIEVLSVEGVEELARRLRGGPALTPLPGVMPGAGDAPKLTATEWNAIMWAAEFVPKARRGDGTPAWGILKRILGATAIGAGPEDLEAKAAALEVQIRGGREALDEVAKALGAPDGVDIVAHAREVALKLHRGETAAARGQADRYKDGIRFLSSLLGTGEDLAQMAGAIGKLYRAEHPGQAAVTAEQRDADVARAAWARSQSNGWGAAWMRLERMGAPIELASEPPSTLVSWVADQLEGRHREQATTPGRMARTHAEPAGYRLWRVKRGTRERNVYVVDDDTARAGVKVAVTPERKVGEARDRTAGMDVWVLVEPVGNIVRGPTRPFERRGIDYPCESCGKVEGSQLVDGWHRCSQCGYPGK